MGPFGSQLKKHELVNHGIRVVWIENVVNNKFEYKKGKLITKTKFSKLKGVSIKTNDILVTMMGTIGRTCVVPSDIDQTIISSHLLKITPKKDLIDSKFLAYLLRGDPNVLKQIESKARGVVMKGLNTKIIKLLEFSLPPLNEQKRIIEKIEELFSIIDKTQKYLYENKLKISQYRYSFLQKQFDQNWTSKSLEDIMNSIRDGTHNPPKRTAEGVPLLSARNIQNGYIDWEKKYSKISRSDFNEITKNNSIVEQDILLTIVGTLGRSCVVRISKSFTVQRSVAILKPKPETFSLFVKHYFDTSQFQNDLKRNARGIAQVGVYLNILKKFLIPFPDLPIQELVVKNIEHTLSIIKKYEETNDILLKFLFTCKKSILKHAFEGELILQDPNDEPAEILLQKTKQEKKQLKQKEESKKRTKNAR